MLMHLDKNHKLLLRALPHVSHLVKNKKRDQVCNLMQGFNCIILITWQILIVVTQKMDC